MSWIKWNGGGCPVYPDQVVTVQLRDGEIATDSADCFYWTYAGRDDEVLAYCVEQENGLIIQPEQLRELMKATGLSQSEIAGKLYTSLGTLKEWLAGNNLGSTGQKANYNARCELLAKKIKDGSLTDARKMVEGLGL